MFNIIVFYSLERNEDVMRRLVLSSVAAATLALVAGCGTMSSSQSSEPPPNTDPTKDWVQVWDTGNTGQQRLWKRCDGTTLIYWDRDYRAGVAAIANSPECM
jgi:hypothetical protein